MARSNIRVGMPDKITNIDPTSIEAVALGSQRPPPSLWASPISYNSSSSCTGENSRPRRESANLIARVDDGSKKSPPRLDNANNAPRTASRLGATIPCTTSLFITVEALNSRAVLRQRRIVQLKPSMKWSVPLRRIGPPNLPSMTTSFAY